MLLLVELLCRCGLLDLLEVVGEELRDVVVDEVGDELLGRDEGCLEHG